MKLDITVGKYTLESLTNGMYASPLDLYREYIQNAVDSFDEAVDKNIEQKDNCKIKIILDSQNKKITILDNGCGIKNCDAVKTLLDIGNSRKSRSVSRGFRGIGRLAGLGYCQKLIFTTSAKGESIKTIVTFDAQKLKELLMSTNENNVSVQDVFEEIVLIKKQPEKSSAHYFEVTLHQVDMANKLMDSDKVKAYLIQNCPVPFTNSFQWGSMINKKIEMFGISMKDYLIELNIDGDKQNIYKAYDNTFTADRVKKIVDTIQDVSIVPFYRKDKISAVLWFAKTSYFGTITDNIIKGIRIRQGNILIGGKTTCNQFFKEERFNGWIIGELHIFDNELIINSRRDDFEKNAAYFEFVDLLSEWSISVTKEIRKKSYERSLTNEKKAIVEIECFDDVNGLGTEDLDFACDCNEASLMESGDSLLLAENDFYDKLSLILNHKKAQTKYSALNINERLTIEQRKVLERVFDLISQEYDRSTAERFISTISKKY